MVTNAPFPWMPPKSTEQRLLHFDEDVYTADSSTILYKWMDAMVGTTGVGNLLNQVFLARLNGALETIYYNDLDYIFGKLGFLARSPAESYSYSPMTDLLTTAQWDEVRIKDAWYRQRIKDFWVACGLGGTPDGIRMGIQAALGCDCDIYEEWRYIDNFGLTANLGRAPVNARNEVVVKPYKSSLAPAELRLARDMLARFTPVSSIITINTSGLAVATPVPISAAAADSVYYEVVKTVTPTPVLSQIPPPAFLPINLNDSEQWLFSGTPTEAPTAAFNSTSEYSYFYLDTGGTRSEVDSVTYGTLQADGVTVNTEQNFQVFNTTGSYTDWLAYEKADSPDNYPGGKFGIHPAYVPALNPDGTIYTFPWSSQDAYVTFQITRVEALGGIADANHYKLPINTPASTAEVFWPDYAMASAAPPKESTVSSSLTMQRPLTTTGASGFDPTTFTRTT